MNTTKKQTSVNSSKTSCFTILRNDNGDVKTVTVYIPSKEDEEEYYDEN